MEHIGILKCIKANPLTLVFKGPSGGMSSGLLTLPKISGSPFRVLRPVQGIPVKSRLSSRAHGEEPLSRASAPLCYGGFEESSFSLEGFEPLRQIQS